MSASFSDRLGLTAPKRVLQIESMDADLRNGLWQACIEHFLRPFGDDYRFDDDFRSIVEHIYIDFFKKPSDQMPYGYGSNISEIRDWFFKAKWWGAYNFVEFLMRFDNPEFQKRVSFFLEREKSGYRIIRGQLVPISDPLEIATVSDAANLSDQFSGARQHVQSAIALFSQKPDPDYRNAIKEAISAVESAVRIVAGTPKATLGDALKKIDQAMAIHPALREAMNRLYGYTSDQGGIRHAMLEQSNIDEAEAKFMLVACSAFINFCAQRSAS